MKPGITEILTGCFYKWCNSLPEYIIPLPEIGFLQTVFQDKRGRQTGHRAYNEDLRENEAFLYLARHLRSTGNNVPEIFYADPEGKAYLLEDLGDMTLHDFIISTAENRKDGRRYLKCINKVIEAMPSLQVEAAAGLDYSKCYPRAEFDAQSIIWDLHYFKYSLLKPLRIDFFEQDLKMTSILLLHIYAMLTERYFMFRIFSREI
jgi:hypothetical protein